MSIPAVGGIGYVGGNDWPEFAPVLSSEESK